MKRLPVFLLFIAFSGFSQPVETSKIPLKGKIHSIITDQPKQEFDFIVDILEGRSFIYQYRAEELVETFELEDQIYNLYVTSDGMMYVTLSRTDRLLILDYHLKEPIVSLDKRYSIIHGNENYLFATKTYASPGNVKEYYENTGLVILKRQTLEEIKFLPATFFVGGGQNVVLLKEIIHWGYHDESSKLYTFDINSLIQKDFVAQLPGIAPETLTSISPNSQFVSYPKGADIAIADILNDRMLKTKQINARRINFITNNQFYVLESFAGTYLVKIFELNKNTPLQFQIDKAVVRNRGRVRIHHNNQFLLVFSQKSNTVQRIKI